VSSCRLPHAGSRTPTCGRLSRSYIPLFYCPIQPSFFNVKSPCP
jgi:hypothetical protein